MEYFTNKIPFFQINSLMLFGVVLFGGLVAGRFFQKLKIPQVVGDIIFFALSLIGFMVGGSSIKENIDHLPVISEGKGVMGFIERKLLNRFVSVKVIELQQQVDSLDMKMGEEPI